MALELFKNNISTTLAVGINSSATTITVATGTGANFPALSGGNYFRAVLTSSAVPGSSYEYLVVTAVSGDNLTVIRGQEGVAAASWNAGDIIYMAATAASDANFAQAADLSGYAPIASPTFTGNPAGPTPAQFDNDTSLATTGFVQRALGNIQGYQLFASGNVTLTAADCGKFSVGASNTLTLPLLSAVNNGATIAIGANTAGNVTISAQGSDLLYTAFGSSVATITLTPADTAEFTSNGGGWILTGGTLLNKYASSFAKSLAASGYQKLPSGLIIQWGSILCSTGGAVTFTYPIAFPNAYFQGFATAGTLAANFATTQNQTASSFGVNLWSTAGARVADFVACLVIGY